LHKLFFKFRGRESPLSGQDTTGFKKSSTNAFEFLISGKVVRKFQAQKQLLSIFVSFNLRPDVRKLVHFKPGKSSVERVQ